MSPQTDSNSRKPGWEIIVAIAFGIVFVVVMLGFSVKFPNPTPSQYAVFKTVLALAAAGVGAVLPGVLNLELPLPKGVLRASGAVVLFVVVFFFTPKPPETPQSETHGNITQQVDGDSTGVINTGNGNVQIAK